MHRAKQKNPSAVVVAVGCYVQTDLEGVEKDPAIDLAIGNNRKKDIAEILEQYLRGREGTESDSPAGDAGGGMAQVICFLRLRFIVPSCMSPTLSRLLPVPLATHWIAFSATMVGMPVRAVISRSKPRTRLRRTKSLRPPSLPTLPLLPPPQAHTATIISLSHSIPTMRTTQ